MIHYGGHDLTNWLWGCACSYEELMRYRRLYSLLRAITLPPVSGRSEAASLSLQTI